MKSSCFSTIHLKNICFVAKFGRFFKCTCNLRSLGRFSGLFEEFFRRERLDIKFFGACGASRFGPRIFAISVVKQEQRTCVCVRISAAFAAWQFHFQTRSRPTRQIVRILLHACPYKWALAAILFCFFFYQYRRSARRRFLQFKCLTYRKKKFRRRLLIQFVPFCCKQLL